MTEKLPGGKFFSFSFFFPHIAGEPDLFRGSPRGADCGAADPVRDRACARQVLWMLSDRAEIFCCMSFGPISFAGRITTPGTVRRETGTGSTMTTSFTLARGNRICLAGRYTGYSLARGGFCGTCNDRIDRWYIDNDSDTTLDRRGPGHRTRAEALDAFARRNFSEIVPERFLPGASRPRY